MGSKRDVEKANLATGREEEKEAEDFELEMKEFGKLRGSSRVAELAEKVFGKEETIH